MTFPRHLRWAQGPPPSRRASDIVGTLDGRPITQEEHDMLVLESRTDRWRHGTMKYPDGGEWWMGGGSGGVFWRNVRTG